MKNPIQLKQLVLGTIIAAFLSGVALAQNPYRRPNGTHQESSFWATSGSCNGSPCVNSGCTFDVWDAYDPCALGYGECEEGAPASGTRSVSGPGCDTLLGLCYCVSP